MEQQDQFVGLDLDVHAKVHAAVQRLGEALEVPPELLAPAGVVIKTPEELAAEEAARLVPYEKADRTPAGPLQQLEAFTASWRGIDVQRLVSLLGAITEHGSVALFALTVDRAATEHQGYYVSSYDERTGRFASAARYQRDKAEHLYAQRVEELS